MAFTFTTPERMGMIPIANVDSGYTPPNGTTAIPSSGMNPGTIATAFDPVQGECEFIFLPGVASLAVGLLVRYNAALDATTIVTNTGNQAVPVAVAMSAPTATQWGWFQISGLAKILKTAVAVSPTVTLFLSGTAGRVKVIASAGLQILGCRTANAASVTSTTSTITALINRPHLQGQIT